MKLGRNTVRSVGRHAMLGPVAAAIAAAVVLILIKPQLGRYEVDVATTMLIYAAVATAWNVLGGYGGMFSLGSAAFVGSGAYASALALIHLGSGYVIALAVATVVSGLLATIASAALLRLRGDYFTIGTLALALALQAWALNSGWMGQSTGLTLPQLRIPRPEDLYTVAVVVAAIALVTSIVIARSSFGLRLMAIRDDQDAAESLGVGAFRHRLAAFVISGAITGLAGGVLAMQQLQIVPETAFNINWTLNAVLICVIGGMGTLCGPWLGTLVVYYGLTKHLEGEGAVSLIIEGVILIAVVRLAPEGIWPLLVRLAKGVLNRRRDPLPPEPVRAAPPA